MVMGASRGASVVEMDTFCEVTKLTTPSQSDVHFTFFSEVNVMSSNCEQSDLGGGAAILDRELYTELPCVTNEPPLTIFETLGICCVFELCLFMTGVDFLVSLKSLNK